MEHYWLFSSRNRSYSPSALSSTPVSTLRQALLCPSRLSSIFQWWYGRGSRLGIFIFLVASRRGRRHEIKCDKLVVKTPFSVHFIFIYLFLFFLGVVERTCACIKREKAERKLSTWIRKARQEAHWGCLVSRLIGGRAKLGRIKHLFRPLLSCLYTKLVFYQLTYNHSTLLRCYRSLRIFVTFSSSCCCWNQLF